MSIEGKLALQYKEGWNDGYECAAKVYQKAFEDIRAELDGYDDTDLIKVKYVRQFIDKHNPDKMESERTDADSN